MFQFGAIKFCRTFKNYFGHFVWIEKKRKKELRSSRVPLHEAPTQTQLNKTNSDQVTRKRVSQVSTNFLSIQSKFITQHEHIEHENFKQLSKP